MANRLSMDQAVRILETRELISEPGKYRVKVTNTVPFVRETENGSQSIVICGLSAMTTYQLKQAQSLLRSGEVDKACNQGLSISSRIGRDYVPSKGEYCHVIVEYVTTKTGEQALLATSITPLPVTETTKVKLGVAANVATEVFDTSAVSAE